MELQGRHCQEHFQNQKGVHGIQRTQAHPLGHTRTTCLWKNKAQLIDKSQVQDPSHCHQGSNWPGKGSLKRTRTKSKGYLRASSLKNDWGCTGHFWSGKEEEKGCKGLAWAGIRRLYNYSSIAGRCFSGNLQMAIVSKRRLKFRIYIGCFSKELRAGIIVIWHCGSSKRVVPSGIFNCARVDWRIDKRTR